MDSAVVPCNCKRVHFHNAKQSAGTTLVAY